jgi:hypothetical protein
MADRPEIGQEVHICLEDMLASLKEHQELCTVTPFPAMRMLIQLAYDGDERYQLTVRRMDDPERVVKSEVVDVPGVAFRYSAMISMNEIASIALARRMAEAGIGEVEQYLKEASGE